MIVGVHTHLATHQRDIPPEEERLDTVMRPDNSGLRLAYESGITSKLLLASDRLVSTPEENVAALRGLDRFTREHHLPEVAAEVLEGIPKRGSLGLLEME